MTPWWTLETGTLIGAFGGGGLGALGGLYGAVAGWLAPRGIGKGVLLPIHLGFILLGAVALVGGIAAVIGGQPYHVFYPLLLIGVLMTCVMGGLFPVIRMRYRHAEARRMGAAELRRG